MHCVQVTGVCALLRKCLSLLLYDCRLLGLHSIELALTTDAVLDGLHLVLHLRVGRSSRNGASELKRTLGWVDHGCLGRGGQSEQCLLRLHPSRQFLGRDLPTKNVQHTLSTGATGRDVALLAQHLISVGYCTRPRASHDDWATHRSDDRAGAGKSQRSAGGST